MNLLHATNTDIGKRAYVFDNSHCTNLRTHKDGDLATWLSNPAKPMKNVIIHSSPFILEVKAPRRQKAKKEFVLVKYEGELYVVLNQFIRIF